MSVAAPRVVTAFEGKLLRVLRCFVRQVPPEQALALVLERNSRPAKLSRACVELVESSLAIGCVLFLVRAGGWRRERFLRKAAPRDGRLWERSTAPDLALNFSRHALTFLIWVTAQKPTDADPPLELPETELTPADRLLLFLAYDALRETEAGPPLLAKPAFARHGLIRLAYPEDVSALEDAAADIDPWIKGQGAIFLEALQPWLADRWVRLERSKAQVGDWQTLAALGRAQEKVLVEFAAAAERADRPDLIRFLLRAARAVLTSDQSAAFFFSGLQGSGPPRLAERVEVHRSALALPRHVGRLAAWAQRARGVGYLDDGYAVNQLWLADWELFRGAELTARAETLLRQVEPLNL